jgi:ATP-dependent Clp protease ATP-binding subunit ClpA
MPFINDKLQAMEEAQPSYAPYTGKKTQTRFRFDVEEVMDKMRKRIYGQEQAMQSIENMLKIVRSDIADPDKPLYVGLFLGPTGVGKTEIVRTLAEIIHGSKDRFCRVDMNTLAQDHYAAALTGAPPGYVGSKEGSTILDKEKIEGSFSKPGIVLFDEIEKAGPQVLLTLLNIFDNGMMTISSGDKVIDFRNSIICMTSNLAASDIYRFNDRQLSSIPARISYYLNPANWVRRDQSLLDRIVMRKLEKSFKPEFINRIDDIVTFEWLAQPVLEKVTEVLVDQLNARLRKHHCKLQIDESARDFLAQKGYNKKFGARALKRVFRSRIEVPLAEILMERPVGEASGVYTACYSPGEADVAFIHSFATE